MGYAVFLRIDREGPGFEALDLAEVVRGGLPVIGWSSGVSDHETRVKRGARFSFSSL